MKPMPHYDCSTIAILNELYFIIRAKFVVDGKRYFQKKNTPFF